LCWVFFFGGAARPFFGSRGGGGMYKGSEPQHAGLGTNGRMELLLAKPM
jgi:hypothetical protein